MINTLVRSVVLYGCETCTLLKEEINKLQAPEMWLRRALGKINWRNKIDKK